MAPNYSKPPYFLYFASPFLSSQRVETEILNAVGLHIGWQITSENGVIRDVIHFKFGGWIISLERLKLD